MLFGSVTRFESVESGHSGLWHVATSGCRSWIRIASAIERLLPTAPWCLCTLAETRAECVRRAGARLPHCCLGRSRSQSHQATAWWPPQAPALCSWQSTSSGPNVGWWLAVVNSGAQVNIAVTASVFDHNNQSMCISPGDGISEEWAVHQNDRAQRTSDEWRARRALSPRVHVDKRVCFLCRDEPLLVHMKAWRKWQPTLGAKQMRWLKFRAVPDRHVPNAARRKWFEEWISARRRWRRRRRQYRHYSHCQVSHVLACQQPTARPHTNSLVLPAPLTVGQTNKVGGSHFRIVPVSSNWSARWAPSSSRWRRLSLPLRTSWFSSWTTTGGVTSVPTTQSE